MLRAERARLVQCRVGEFLQRQARELGVDLSVVIIHASRTYLTGLPGRIAVCPACRNFRYPGLFQLVKNCMIEWLLS